MGGMGRARRALFITTFALFGCSSQAVPAATPTLEAVSVRFGANSATQPLMRDVSQEYMTAHPNITLETTLTRREQPDLDSYFVTNHLPPDSDAWAAPIGQDGIAVIAHPTAGVQSLTTEELRDIYRGRVASWAAVGGAAQSIQVVSREDGAGTRAEFERLVMGARSTTRTALIAPSSVAMVDTVTRTPGAVGYVSMGYLGEELTPLAIDGVMPTRETVRTNVYPLRSTLFVVGAREPEGVYRAFIAWLQSSDGQAIIARRYVPLLAP